MSKDYLGIIEDIDGNENLVSLYGAKEVEEFVTLLEEDTSYKLTGIQAVTRLMSLHDLKNIINGKGYPGI